MKTSLILALSAFTIFSELTAMNTARAEAPVVPTATVQQIGTISAFGSSFVSLRAEAAGRPVRYSASATTTFMDENGASIPLSMLKPGVPVSVDYVRVGDRCIARRVIVLRSLTAGPAIVQKAPIMTAAVERN